VTWSFGPESLIVSIAFEIAFFFDVSFLMKKKLERMMELNQKQLFDE
jgi:hypothetical protein